MTRAEIERELAEARQEYCRLLEVEKYADPAYLDVIIYQIKAQELRLAALKRELEKAG